MKKYRKKTGVRRDRWKKNDAAAVAFVFLTVLGLLFYYLGMTRQRELERYDNRITLIRSDGNAYSCMEAEQMRIRNQEAEDPFSYVLWGKGVSVSFRTGIWDGLRKQKYTLWKEAAACCLHPV